MKEQKNKKINNSNQYFEKLFHYYIEFLIRSDPYRNWLKSQNEIKEEIKGLPLRIIPANIDLKKKRKPIKPDEINKPVIFSSLSKNNQFWGIHEGMIPIKYIHSSFNQNKQGVWDITKKFRCDLDRLILEIDIEKPIEVLKEQFKEIIKSAQEKYWKECNNENYYGEYRYLKDFMMNEKGKYKEKRKITFGFNTWDNFLKIYDLRIKDISSKEVAKIVFKDDALEKDDNFKSAEQKVNKYFERAKKLIDAAVVGKFPPISSCRKSKIRITGKQKAKNPLIP